MDNVIQNININDIIPIDNNIDPNELNELVDSIRKFGIIEPLILKPVNNKYEIVLGNKIYLASKVAGINLLPAIIKNIDNQTIEEYRIISNMAKDKINDNNIPLNQNNTNQEIDSDIVNLQELSKQEYEREDVKMNNEQNNMMNNNIGANPTIDNQSQEPTFGGKFFPSLEDEPTNMNMETQSFNPPPVNEPVNPVQPNFIDLTDSSAAPAPTPELNPIQQQPTLDNNVQNIEPQQPAPVENVGNTINLENLTAGYNTTVPEQPPMNEPLPEMNNEIPPVNEQSNNIPQFDMSQAVAPNPMMSPDIGLGINGNSVDQMPNSMNEPMDIGVPNYNEPLPEINNAQPIQNINGDNNQNMNFIPPMNEPLPEINNAQPVLNINGDNNQDMNFAPPTDGQIDNIDNNTQTINNSAPVINTIKSLAENLTQFGYNINIGEEETPTSTKIIIEIQK